jgi:hypothetical protein
MISVADYTETLKLHGYTFRKINFTIIVLRETPKSQFILTLILDVLVTLSSRTKGQ